MSQPTGSYFSNLIESVGNGWNRFWFTTADPLPLCILRIAIGVLTLAHFVTLASDIDRWYSPDGLLPPAAVTSLLSAGTQQESTYHYSYLSYLQNPLEQKIAYGAALVVAALFTIGFLTRLSGVLTLVAMLAYVHRVPQVAGHIEPLLSFLLIYLTIGPSGALLSLDSLFNRSRDSKLPGAPAVNPREPSLTANIAIRLLQVHLAMFVAMMGLTKLYGDSWWQGEAIWMLMAQTESRPLNLTSLRDAGQFGEYVINFWTLAIVYFELAFPLLVWNRLARPLLVGLGIVVWLSLSLVTGLVLFSLTLVIASLAFLPPDFFESFRPSSSRAPALA